MKTNFYLLLLLLMFSTSVLAQLSKGTFYLQGSTYLRFLSEKDKVFTGSSTQESTKYSYFGIKPKIGYFVMDNLPIGIKMDANFKKTKYINTESEYTSSELIFGPFARYYFLEQDKLKPFAEIFFGIGNYKSKDSYSGSLSESKYAIFEYGIGAGASYFVTENVAFDLMLNYYSTKYTNKESSSSGVKSTNADKSGDIYSGIRAELGVVVVIPGK